MSPEELQLKDVEAALSLLPEDARSAVLQAEARLNAVIEAYGDAGLFAAALVGAKLAARAEKEDW